MLSQAQPHRARFDRARPDRARPDRARPDRARTARSAPGAVFALLMVTASLVLGATPASATEATPVYSPAFLDVADDANFAPDIRALVNSGVTRGCDDLGRFFCPDDAVTRGQMAAFLVRALDLADNGSSFFPGDDTIFGADVATLATAGIARGCNPPENTTFCPEEPITRAQMATFMVRALDLDTAGPDPATNTFTDVSSDNVHATDIAALAAAGITKGCNPPLNSEFCPGASVTRAQMAAFLVRGVPLAAVAAVPDGVVLKRIEHPTEPVGTLVQVCPNGTALEVRNAAWGSVYPAVGADVQPIEISVAAGDYDQAADVWTTTATDDCLDLTAVWDDELHFVDPVAEYVLTSPFGFRTHPYGGSRFHAGIDMGVPQGTRVSASEDGVVTAAGSSISGFGLLIEVTHANGFMTRSAHLSSIGVSVGDKITSGDEIGSSGCTGSCTGPHLHFEIHKYGSLVDPLDYLG